MSAKKHIIISPLSDYSSPIITQRSCDIGNPGIAWGHCLQCSSLYFFQTGGRIYLSCAGVVGVL